MCTLHVCAGSNLCDTATVRHWEELKQSQGQGHLTLNCGPRQAAVWQKQKRNGPELGKVPQSYGRSGMGLDGIGIPKYTSLFWILSPPFLIRECQLTLFGFLLNYLRAYTYLCFPRVMSPGLR